MSHESVKVGDIHCFADGHPPGELVRVDYARDVPGVRGVVNRIAIGRVGRVCRWLVGMMTEAPARWGRRGCHDDRRSIGVSSGLGKDL